MTDSTLWREMLAAGVLLSFIAVAIAHVSYPDRFMTPYHHHRRQIKSLISSRTTMALGEFMMRKAVLVISIVGASLSVQLASAQGQSQAAAVGPSKTEFVIGPKFIRVPEGSFLLIRKGRDIGAIRLISVVQDAKGIGKSTYESYFQGDGSGSFRGSGVVRRTGEIEIKPMKSLSHTLTWQPGESKLWVGKWWFGCYSPSLVNMASHFAEKDEGYEFAPTSAQSIGEIDASDKRLQWFRYLDDKKIPLAVSDLPK